MKNKNKVDVNKLQSDFFKIITQEASEFRKPGEGPSMGFLYGRVAAILQELAWVPEVQQALQSTVDRHYRAQARLAVPAESI